MIQDIQGWLSENEGKLLGRFAKNTPGNIVEIGSFHGKSTIYMARETKKVIYAIDPHEGKTHLNKKLFPQTYRNFLANLKKFKVTNVVAIRKSSKEASKNWRKKISLLHIDGLHEYLPVKEDIKSWLPHLENTGVVVFHDAFAPYPEVWQAVKEEIFDKNFGYVGINDSQIFAIKNNFSFNPQKPFIILTSNTWHNEKLPYFLRDFIVKRILKPFYLNKFVVSHYVKSIFEDNMLSFFFGRKKR